MMQPPIMPPMMPTNDEKAKPPTRFLVRYGIPVCQRCSFAAMYCMCSRTPAADTAPEDGPAAASLGQRILDVKR